MYAIRSYYERRDEQSEHRWFRDHSGTLAGRTIGIMGTGSIGSHIAGTAKAFGMAVRGLSRNGAPVDVFDEVFPVAQLEGYTFKVVHADRRRLLQLQVKIPPTQDEDEASSL